MRKIAFTAVVLILLIFGLSFGVNIAPSYAADIPSTETISSQDTQALNSQLESMKSLLAELQKQQAAQKQAISVSSKDMEALKEGLNALKNSLTILQMRLANNDLTLEEKNAVAITLFAIAKSLSTINSSLGSQNLAMADKISQPAPIVQKSEITAKEADEESLFENQALEQENKQVASLNFMASLKKLPLPAIMIGLAVITAIIMAWLFVMRNKEPKTETSKA